LLTSTETLVFCPSPNSKQGEKFQAVIIYLPTEFLVRNLRNYRRLRKAMHLLIQKSKDKKKDSFSFFICSSSYLLLKFPFTYIQKLMG
jgi:hypothetical protein